MPAPVPARRSPSPRAAPARRALRERAAGSLLALAAAIPALGTPPARAQDEGRWIVRGRATQLDPRNHDTTGLGLSINERWLPELDITRFLSPNWAVELVLTTPQQQHLRAAGSDIGRLRHLPPVLSLQHHVTGLDGWRPYVGVGVNLTRFSSVALPPGVRIDRSSLGPALGAGVDLPVGGGWLLNLDVKKVWLDTEVSAGGSRLGRLDVDPLLLSLGLGRRF